MAGILGVRGTGNFGTDERPKSFRETILWREPNGEAPLTGLMSKLGKGTLTDPEHSWWEEDLTIVRLQLNDATDMLAGDTTFVVDSGAYLLSVGDLLMVEKEGSESTGLSSAYTAEVIKVTAVNSDTEFEASRGYAGSTAAAITDDSYFLRIGSAFSEGTRSPVASTRNPTKFSNYAQIWKTSYELTGTANASTYRTGDPLKNDKTRRMFDHSINLELSTLFGKKSEITGANGKPERTAGGLLEFLAAAGRVYRFAAAPTTATFFDAIYDVFDYSIRGGGSGNTRLALCGNGALNKLNKIVEASGEVHFVNKVTLYGMDLHEFVMPQGTLYLKTHPLMNRHPVFTHSMFILNPPGLRWLPLRDTKPMENIQHNDEDTIKGQWMTEGTFEFNHMVTMKYIGGMNAA